MSQQTCNHLDVCSECHERILELEQKLKEVRELGLYWQAQAEFLAGEEA